ncbi:hypothetical protein GH807_16870 [Acetobacterium tundrae]|uniref:Dinitrogenase iron-molybdenum cofactor biosynthesis domain-containing protein n=2 Tax=Acetobacterium tundrae TaxID=132932 RepID=A0ABR6WQP6_9FIRM|nr:hypothetical protein [Acetobacterium tundrae]
MLFQKGSEKMSYRVAITSSDGKCIDQHFGNTKIFYVLQIEETGKWEMLELRKAEEAEIKKLATEQGKFGECSGHNDVFLDYVSNLLSDCTYLLTSKIGMRPYKVLMENNINTLEAPHDLSVAIEKINNYYLKNK